MNKLKKRELNIKLSPYELYEKINHTFDNTVLLESASGPKRFVNLSILGFEPEFMVRYVDKGGGKPEYEGSAPPDISDNSPLGALREVVSRYRVDGGHTFPGGLIGYMSYELVRFMDGLSLSSDFPIYEFGMYLDGIVYDHNTRKIWYFTSGEDRVKEVMECAEAPKPPPERFTHSEFKVNIPEDEFIEGVKTCKSHIREGDIFQAVLSKRYQCRFTGNPFDLYRRLRAINPSPYMYILDFGKRKIIGSSPEMLVKLKGKNLIMYPIAGTRPIGGDEDETKRFMEDMLNDPKERAEHNMLVDLARNDLGRVCRFGSVKVAEYMTVERFSHVQHIVSRVTGSINPGLDAVDAIESVFPAGTVSGAPKIRAMEIISEIEKEGRGPYAGAVGYFGLNGNMDTAITIRTFVINNSHLYFQAGAGIVHDSDPQKEWAETEHKLNVLREVLGEVQ